jgi:GT2 family glycosyltransferase
VNTSTIRAAVLNHNGGEKVVAAVRSILASELPRHELDVVVVDNASSDDSTSLLAQQVPAARLVRNPANLGYPGLNAVLRDLDGIDCVAILNPDASVEPDTLRRLADALDVDEHCGAACPRIVLDGDHHTIELAVSGPPRRRLDLLAVTVDGAPIRWHATGDAVRRRWDHGVAWSVGHRSIVRVAADAHATCTLQMRAPTATEVTFSSGDWSTSVTLGRQARAVEVGLRGPAQRIVQNAGSIIGYHGLGINRGYHEPDGPRFDVAVDVPAWCGAGVLLRTEYLRDVGLFDQRWFLYYEDLDVSWRGQLRGWRYRYVPEARVSHQHSATIGHGSALYDHFHERNRLLTITKNGPAAAALASWANSARLVAWQAKGDVAARLRDRRHPELVLTARRTVALAAALRHLPGVFRSRRDVRRYRLRDDAGLPILGRWRDPTEQSEQPCRSST